jgi:hypothetical protein
MSDGNGLVTKRQLVSVGGWLVLYCFLFSLTVISPRLSIAGPYSAIPERGRERLFSEPEYTPEQLREMDAAVAKAWRENPNEYRSMVAVAQMWLAVFGFGTGPIDGVLDKKTSLAIREYQGLRQLPQTGDLNFRTVRELGRDGALWRREAAVLPKLVVIVDFWDANWVSAQGTWTIVGEKCMIPVQTSKIDCYRERGICVESTARMTNFAMSNSLSTETEIYEIERWDKYEIVTKPFPGGNRPCFQYTMRIDRTQKSVTGFKLRIDDSCGDLLPEEHFKLVDGSEIENQLKSERDLRLRGLVRGRGIILR